MVHGSRLKDGLGPGLGPGAAGGGWLGGGWLPRMRQITARSVISQPEASNYSQGNSAHPEPSNYNQENLENAIIRTRICVIFGSRQSFSLYNSTGDLGNVLVVI